MKLEPHDASFDCPGCGEPIVVPLSARADGSQAVIVTVDTGPARAHAAERHPDVAASLAAALDEAVREAVPT